jgi:ectoine hydroxylase-related dioxygenase (phytanoyl-CoA dioxygenase family)
MDPFERLAATPDEVAQGALSSGRQARVVASIRTHGAAIVTDAVDDVHCDALSAVMAEDLDAAARHPFALDIPGHVQHNPPPRARDIYADIIANPIALSVARALMGRVRLSLYTGNTMLPHTTQQQPVHWDEYQLWPAMEQAPPVASLAVNIPLVDVTTENGALEVWPGTHLDVRSIEQFSKSLLVPEAWLEARRRVSPPVRVPLPKGALLLRDLRMWHRGTTNSTSVARPMLAVSYQPWWYRPLAIDFFPDAEPVLAKLRVPVMARYRERFDHLAWPPNWDLIPAPVDEGD